MNADTAHGVPKDQFQLEARHDFRRIRSGGWRPLLTPGRTQPYIAPVPSSDLIDAMQESDARHNFTSGAYEQI